MKLRFLTILYVAFTGISFVRAQHATFLSKTLTDIAKGINYQPVDSLSAGEYEIDSYMGLPVYAEYNDKHIVTNLGLRLFSPDLKQVYSSDVYSFLERYILELYTWKGKNSVQQKLMDDKVYFTQGTIADIKKITNSSLVSVNRTEDKFYTVSWSNGSQQFLSISFPIQYELLLGMPQVEIEQKLHDMVVESNPVSCTPDSTAEYELVENNIYRTKPLLFYEIKSLNTATYYEKSADNTYQLLLDTQHSDYSVTNIFHAFTKCDNPLNVQQSVYGFKKLEYSITLHQWMNYCIASGLRIYTAIEEEYNDGYKILIVLENRDLGYNHLLSVTVPKDFIAKPTVAFNVKLNAFIPTHNVKDIYQQYTVQKKKNF